MYFSKFNKKKNPDATKNLSPFRVSRQLILFISMQLMLNQDIHVLVENKSFIRVDANLSKFTGQNKVCVGRVTENGQWFMSGLGTHCLCVHTKSLIHKKIFKREYPPVLTRGLWIISPNNLKLKIDFWHRGYLKGDIGYMYLYWCIWFLVSSNFLFNSSFAHQAWCVSLRLGTIVKGPLIQTSARFGSSGPGRFPYFFQMITRGLSQWRPGEIFTAKKYLQRGGDRWRRHGWRYVQVLYTRSNCKQHNLLRQGVIWSGKFFCPNSHIWCQQVPPSWI
jgi:hypothetical protein